MAGFGDDEIPAAPEHPDGLCLRQLPPRGGVVRVDGHDATLGLGDDLLGDHEDVARHELRSGSDHGGEIVADSHLRQPEDTEDREPDGRFHVGILP